MNQKYRIAIVHDFLNKTGGAEMTLKEMGAVWPKAPIYTLMHKEELGLDLPNQIRESYIKKLPGLFKERPKLALPFLIVAPETLDLRNYRVVLTSSGAFSKSVITKPETLNICYCHSPTRYLWDYTHQYVRNIIHSNSIKFLTRFLINYIRIWDAVSADRVDYFIANSKATREKIKKYYRSDSALIYPPVKVDELYSRRNQQKNFFLVVSRLSKYKKIDIIIKAFNKLGWELIVIGEGEEFKRLKKMAGPTVKMLGFKERKEVIDYYRSCKAFIQASDEDFGISTVEAMACGKPVLAFEKGGAKEIVQPGISGEFFKAQTVEVLAEGVYRINSRIKKYNSRDIIESVQKFSDKRFRKELRNFIESKLEG
ncbi:MAG: glycosyltransferase [Candidatus Moranbacteria bacterium]|nr:glycosyltransferase [Candidatus Moranbacteria bacterium]